MAEVTISREAVDKAAHAYIAEIRAKFGWGVEFDQLTDIEKDNARETAMAMLNAAAPLILADEHERLAHELSRLGDLRPLVAGFRYSAAELRAQS